MASLAQAFKQQGVQEVRFLFCQKSAQSAGIRNFLQSNFTPLKSAYPKLPLLVREAQGQQPMVIARFQKGTERGISVQDKTPEEIQQSILQLIQTPK